MRTILLSILFACLFMGCSDQTDNPVPEPVEIQVSTGFVTSGAVESRSGGSIYTADVIGGQDLYISMVRLDQTDETNPAYQPYSETNVSGVGQAPRNARLKGEDSRVVMQFDSPEPYLSRLSNNKTKLIGWYPRVETGGSTWSVSDMDGVAVATVGFNVDEETDILFSNLVEGHLGSPFNAANNSLAFHHLLTRIRFRVFTTEATVADIWGGVKSITIKNKKQTCTVELPEVASATNTLVSEITFEGTESLPIIHKNPADGTPIEGYDNTNKALAIPSITQDVENNQLTVGAALAGYAMIAPEAVGLEVVVVAEERTSQAVSIPAPSGGFLNGHSYTVALEFTASSIMPEVTINNWVQEDEGDLVIE